MTWLSGATWTWHNSSALRGTQRRRTTLAQGAPCGAWLTLTPPSHTPAVSPPGGGQPPLSTQVAATLPRAGSGLGSWWWRQGPRREGRPRPGAVLPSLLPYPCGQSKSYSKLRSIGWGIDCTWSQRMWGKGQRIGPFLQSVYPVKSPREPRGRAADSHRRTGGCHPRPGASGGVGAPAFRGHSEWAPMEDSGQGRPWLWVRAQPSTAPL